MPFTAAPVTYARVHHPVRHANRSRNQRGREGLVTLEVNRPVVDIHEAISNIPAPKKKLKGKVIEALEKGYYLNDKVIRFAKVVVGQ